MSKVALCLLIGLLAACAPEGGAPSSQAADTPPNSVTLELWCAAQTPERCIEGMVFLDENPGRLDCMSTAPDDRPLWEMCGQPVARVEPGTTVPTPESEADQAAAQQAYREGLERRLPQQDERALELLEDTHPDGEVVVGLVLAGPIDPTTAGRLVDDAGASLIAVWRTDYVCLPGLDEMPFATPSRFAYLDGAERAERLRREMEESTTPVTGAMIPLNAFALMEQEARALQEPGVELEALRVEVPVASIETLRNDPRVSGVRMVAFPTDGVDLSEIPVPECK